MKQVHRVHVSYIEPASESWLVASGGRCYKESLVREEFENSVRCPNCPNVRKAWFSTIGAYVQHWLAVHQ